MSFSNTKNRIFAGYERISGWLAGRSAPVRWSVYRMMGALFWLVYLLPGTSVRPTLNALARHTGHPAPRRLFADYVTGFLRGIDRLERVRHGHGAEVDPMLALPEQDRINAMLRQGGFILVMPHVHASFAMARGLSQHYPVMSLVRLTADAQRAEAQKVLYRQVGADFHDVRHGDATSVARKLLGSLKQGKIVVGLVDRIKFPAPPQQGNPGEMITARAFDQKISVTAWPARFGHKAGVPIVPATVVQTAHEVRLVLGQTVTPTDDLVTTTQDWVTGLEHLMRAHPEEWAFWLDKNWSQLLRTDPPD